VTADLIGRALAQLEWRHLGPFRGGRVVAVAGHPREPGVFWFGSTGGGVWKTTDAGSNWENVSDGFFGRASVGAIAVAPSDPNVLYVGTGESTLRNTVSHGDGVYRSTDGGASWRRVGLGDSRHIGKIRVHPRDPDVVYVAALGHSSGPSEQRGLYLSRDGGATWTKAIDRGPRAGAIDVTIDPADPRVVYASTWQTLRTPWGITSGGAGSGLFRSRDGGVTWTPLSGTAGFPAGMLGRIGVVASPARPGRVWAVVEAQEGGLYRSDDGGESWTRTSAQAGLWGRSYYYMHVVADPRDAETVWVLNTDCFRSIDGGLTFARVPTPHGDDHDLWIDASDTRRMIVGCDGGAAVSWNGGESWSSIYNQPTAELYHVVADAREPYHVYAAQQDCGTVALPSRSLLGAITVDEARDVGGGEAGQIAVRPDDPDIVFAGDHSGYLTRFDVRTGQARGIEVWPEPAATAAGGAATRHRFTWTYPLSVSPHDPRVLYAAGERVFRSIDEGTTWRAISPDLTRRDPRGMAPAAGRIRVDRAAGDRDQVCTIFTFAESAARAGVLWAGSDDGLVHLSVDGGRSWRDVTPPGLQAWTLITTVEPSPHDPACAYLTASRHLLDDLRPIVLRTRDGGRTWSRISSGIPEGPARVVREDPQRRGLLYCGTEAGAYVSFDDGRHWRRLGGALPVTPVHDLHVKDGDLVAATHGRGFWVVDDITPLRAELDVVAGGRRPHLFAPRRVTHYALIGRYRKPPMAGHNYRIEGALTLDWTPLVRPGERTERFYGAARNPAEGAVIRYWLPRDAADVRVRIADARGRVIASFRAGDPEPAPPRSAGLCRFVWDARHAGPVRQAGAGAPTREREARGPLVAPGTYEVRLEVDGRTLVAPLEVRADPRTRATQEDLRAQERLLLRVRDVLSSANETVNGIRGLREKVRAAASLGRAPTAAALTRRIDALERELVQPPGADGFGDPPKLTTRLATLAVKAGNAQARPTRAAIQLVAQLERRASALRDRSLALERTADTALASVSSASSARAGAARGARSRAGRRRRSLEGAARWNAVRPAGSRSGALLRPSRRGP